MKPCVELNELTFYYPECAEPALDRVTLTVEQGELLVLCGPSGCGKSTLLRQLKSVLAPHGVRTGEIRFHGNLLDTIDLRAQSSRIGFVMQDPEEQVVTDKVWHELAFGLESLGCDTPTIRRRVAEMASFFGIQTWFHRDVTELSGGQKQLLNLAAVMVMQPEVLILDEPTSQLDPIAAADFLAAVGRIHRELGTTVILTEHRLEEAFPLADRAAVLDRGRLLCHGSPRRVGAALKAGGHGMFLAMPTPMRIWAAVDSDAPCPVTVQEGRRWFNDYGAQCPPNSIPPEQIPTCGEEPVLTAEGVWFRYEPNGAEVVKGLDLALHPGELLALMGGNGTGKTTALKLLSGLLAPNRGTVRQKKNPAVLPQNPRTVFVKKTVREDLLEMLSPHPTEEEKRRLLHTAQLCRLGSLLDRHPYDLSGGEQQRAALAKVLLTEPKILLMDEPTKGLDAEFKEIFAEIVERLLADGVAVLMVSHDVEFCARHAHRCALFFDGAVVTEDTPRRFFSGNSFYTTAANRMARGVLPEAVTPEEVITACGGHVTKPAALPQETVSEEPLPERPCPPKLPLWRRLIAAAAGAVILWVFFLAVRTTNLSALVGADGMTAQAAGQLKQYGVLIAALIVLAAAAGRRSPAPASPVSGSKKLTRRTLLTAAAVLVLIPLTLYLGQAVLENRKYYFISLLILFETMIPFFVVFEGRKPQARELVVLAVLCAIGVAGRTAFFMLPQFKPVLALVIISGVGMGAETGFLVGAMTMLASNLIFGQGPWTPWQMFAMGLAGFLAGVLFRKGLLRRSRTALCVFGGFCAIVLYGGIMNTASLLMWADEVRLEQLLTYYITGFPMDCAHAAATVLFLWFGAEPMLEKLDRIKVKYGLIE